MVEIRTVSEARTAIKDWHAEFEAYEHGSEEIRATMRERVGVVLNALGNGQGPDLNKAADESVKLFRFISKLAINSHGFPTIQSVADAMNFIRSMNKRT
jgi:hypothetical protein